MFVVYVVDLNELDPIIPIWPGTFPTKEAAKEAAARQSAAAPDYYHVAVDLTKAGAVWAVYLGGVEVSRYKRDRLKRRVPA